jgi:uncharacterized protein (TIGR02270 family)
MTIIPTIIEQHAEEAAFLWLQRDAAVHDPHYSLKDLAKLDDRVEAHIDGLRIAGDAGWKICKQALEFEEPGEVFAASVLAFEGGDAQCIETVIAAGAASEETWRGLVSAFGWLTQEQVNNLLPGLLKSEKSEYIHLGIAASAIHRQDPGAALVDALNGSESQSQARPLRAVGELKRHDLLPVLQRRFQSENTACCFWAAWSALLLGDFTAVETLKTFTSEESHFRQRAIKLVFRGIDSKVAQSELTELARQPSGLRHAIIGAGVAGDPVRIPWLIELMTQPELARPAGEAFSMITGVDIAYEDLETDAPEDFHAGPTEDPEDEDVEMDPDEDLPWPDPELIGAWWHKNQISFQSGKRYLAGHPISSENCLHVLRNGFQRQRMAAALELALLHPGRPLFEVRAPGYRQQRLLAAGL